MLLTENQTQIATKPGIETHVLPINGNDHDRCWTELFDLDQTANATVHPDYVRSELSDVKTHSRLKAVMIRADRDDGCVALGILVPKRISTSNVGGFGFGWNLHGYRLAGGQFLTTDQTNGEIQSRMIQAAVNHCQSLNAEFLLIEDLDERSPLAASVTKTQGEYQRFAVRELQTRWRIEFPENEQEYWQKFTARTRSKFRARLKKFGESQLDRISRPEDVSAFLEAAHAVSSQSWQSRQFGIRIRNDESERRRLTVLAELGFLRSYVWRVKGQPVAFALCHQRAGIFVYEEIAYLAEYSSLSPGVTLLQQIIEDLYQFDRPSQFDFGGGDAEYKQKFGNIESRSQSLCLVPKGWRGRFNLGYLSLCRHVRSTGRRLVNTSGLATKARQWLRNGSGKAQIKFVASEGDESEDRSPTAKPFAGGQS